MKIYIKDKIDFLKNYESFEQLVFYREVDDKVEIRIAIPSYAKQVKKDLEKIKD